MEENNKTPENENVNNPENAPDEREYYERAYFEGDSLKELEGEDDENEYLASFDTVSVKSERKKSAAGKKRIILLASLAFAAVLLLCLYFFVFRPKENVSSGSISNDGGKPGDDQYYAVTSTCAEILQGIDKDITIRFAQTQEKLESGDTQQYISYYAQTFAYICKSIKLEYGAGSDFCAVICGGNKVIYTESDFFNTLEDGTRYSFNGEQLYGKAVLEVCGMPASDGSFGVWAMPGYDIDGDTVTNNRPYMYPRITRSDVESIKIRNQYGSFRIYRGKNADGSYGSSFYFENSELCSYDQELFASLIVDCTYVLTYGKIREPNALADYGLDSEENATAVIEVFTLDGAYHKILIGDPLPSSGGYYAKYYNKDFVYLLGDSYSSSVLQPAEAYLNATLGYTISQTNDIYRVSDLLIRYFDEGTDIYINQKVDLSLTNVTAVNSSQTPASLLHDKVRAAGDYTGWKSDTKTYVGMKATDGKGDMYFDFQLTNYAYKTGDYAVKFGIVRDSSSGAVLPASATVYYYDPASSSWVEAASLTAFDQGDKSYKQYELSFNTEPRVRYLRLKISGVGSGTLVMDEITTYADGKDGIPNESVAGAWRIMSPESFIQPGYNYATPDISAFSDILYKIVTLVGDEVAERDIYRGTEEEVKARFAKYGLDDPNMCVSYLIDGYRSYIYASHLFNENGKQFFYAYAVINYEDSSGASISVSPQIIAKVDYTTASYFDWSAIDLLDRSAFSMYIDKIDTIEMDIGSASYLFDLQDNDNNGKLDTVVCDGKEIDTAGFRSVYVSLLECYRAGLYTPAEGDLSEANLILTFTMHSELKDTEIKFYRVSSSKVIYCTNGEYSEFYVRYSDVSTVIENVKKLINGEEIRR
ncbi:MAG: DUF4340 domain-containing protein [Clostridia bacterium]|nr:DUF4340 domain-containing protein [Clostridia bacterium]